MHSIPPSSKSKYSSAFPIKDNTSEDPKYPELPLPINKGALFFAAIILSGSSLHNTRIAYCASICFSALRVLSNIPTCSLYSCSIRWLSIQNRYRKLEHDLFLINPVSNLHRYGLSHYAPQLYVHYNLDEGAHFSLR